MNESGTPERKAPKIRPATFADLPELLIMGRELHEENGMLNANDELIAKTALAGIEGAENILVVIGDVGKIEAMLFLCISRFYYTYDLHLEELFAYVRPQYRNSSNARALLAFAKDQAHRLDVPLLIRILSTVDTERKVAMYERMMGKPAGAFFIYNGRTGSVPKTELAPGPAPQERVNLHAARKSHGSRRPRRKKKSG